MNHKRFGFCDDANLGVPPPLDVGDVVKVLGVGSTVLQQEEYTVAAVHGTAIAVEKDGVYLDFPRDRLILTIGSSGGHFNSVQLSA